MSIAANTIKQLIDSHDKAIEGSQPLATLPERFQLDSVTIIQTKRLALPGQKVSEAELSNFILPFVIENQIYSLNLADNFLYSASIRKIAAVLNKENCPLIHLNLAKTNLNLNDIRMLCDALQSNKTLITLNLSNNHLNSECLAIITTMLELNASICTIIGIECTPAITTCLYFNTQHKETAELQKEQTRQSILEAFDGYTVMQTLASSILFGYLNLHQHQTFHAHPHASLQQKAKYTALYLQTGCHPLAVQPNLIEKPQLNQEERISYTNALAEIKGLNEHQLIALDTLFKFKLTGDLLRTFKGPEGFTMQHFTALEYFLKNRNPCLSPTKAIQSIQGSTATEVTEICRIDKEQCQEEFADTLTYASCLMM